MFSTVALVVAFFLAPFQHVHHGDGADHDHGSFIHTHFYRVVLEENEEHGDGGPEIEHRHDGHTASPLDTFTIVPTALFALIFPPQFVVVIPALFPSFVRVEIVEERGHSPPATALSVPRTPPC